jgi:hypothetical protein
MTPTSPTPADRPEPWGGLRNSLSKAYVAADIDNAIEFWRPRIEAEARQQERDRIAALRGYSEEQVGGYLPDKWTYDDEGAYVRWLDIAAIEGDSRG